MPQITKNIPTHIKDSSLVQKRRRQIAEAAVKLFAGKGFHPTTTREIAAEAGFSIGTLYEYVNSKEDVLFLVCESIHQEMEKELKSAINRGSSARNTLISAIANYMEVCDRMQDSILLIYRESGSLGPESRKYVLENEKRITMIFEAILRQGQEDGSLRFDRDKAPMLMAHNITVLGHMWAFRRWTLRSKLKLKEFIGLQTSLILSELSLSDQSKNLKAGVENDR